MGLKETCKAIKRRVDGARAFVELTIGPALAAPIDLDANTSCYPLVPIGNEDNISFGVRLLKLIGVPVDEAFLATAREQGQGFNSITATVYTGLTDEQWPLAGAGLLPAIDRNRSLLGILVGGNPTTMARIQLGRDKRNSAVEFVAPLYRGVHRAPGDPINIEFVRRCAEQMNDDARLHYNISILDQIYGITDQSLKIARSFSLLESMAGPIEAQFSAASDGKGSTSRKAIRFMLGYYVDFHIPRFTVGNDDYVFDHIEFAGRLRHKIFHGGGVLTPHDLTKDLAPGLVLLERRPDLITYMLRLDCEREIAAWANRTSKAWRVQNGEKFAETPRDPHYDGGKLARALVSSAAPAGSPIGSIYATSPQGSLSGVRLEVAPFARKV